MKAALQRRFCGINLSVECTLHTMALAYCTGTEDRPDLLLGKLASCLRVVLTYVVNRSPYRYVFASFAATQ
eukprot:scaffold214885_cov19-Prasinocladus_malaysianus.AAC.1